MRFVEAIVVSENTGTKAGVIDRQLKRLKRMFLIKEKIHFLDVLWIESKRGLIREA